jgi:PKD repeat protein
MKTLKIKNVILSAVIIIALGGILFAQTGYAKTFDSLVYVENTSIPGGFRELGSHECGEYTAQVGYEGSYGVRVTHNPTGNSDFFPTAAFTVCTDVSIWGDFAYVTDPENSINLRKLDISGLIVGGTITEVSYKTGYYGAEGISVKENIAYVTIDGLNNSSIYYFDVSGSNFVNIGDYDLGWFVHTTGIDIIEEATQEFLYVAIDDGTAEKFQIIYTNSIEGSVKYDNGTAISGITITAGGYSDQTDSSGLYSITVPAGTYTITPPGGYVWTPENYPDVEVITEDITGQDFTTPYPAPVANFSANPLSGIAPLTVQFTDLSTNATSWSWTFGDGGSSTARHPSHTYVNPDTYTVSLTATGPGGSDPETKTNYITVSAPPLPPVANFSVQPTAGLAPLIVMFTNESTGDITTYSWNFGDGTTDNVQNPAPHIYDVPRTYTVTLTVTGPGGSDSAPPIDIVVLDTVLPEISITEPANDSVVDRTSILVEGTFIEEFLDKIEVRLAGISDWQLANIDGTNFDCTVTGIPTDGEVLTIEAKATDTSDNTAIDSVDIRYGYVRVISLVSDPLFTVGNSSSKAGIAVAKNMLDLMRPGKAYDPAGDSTMPVDIDIYFYGMNPANRLPENAEVLEFDPKAMDAVMENWDIYEQGYNFGIRSEEVAEYDEYLKEIVHWMSWPVLEVWGSDPPVFTHEPYIPVVLPLNADVHGYTKWVIVDGCAASIDPFAYNAEPWKYAYDITDITVYGFYITDPDEIGGIGTSQYISNLLGPGEGGLQDYLKPMPTSAISGKYGNFSTGEVDQYAGKYVMIAEPPDEDFDVETRTPLPRVNESTLNLIRIAEHVNNKDVGLYTRHLIDGALVVKLEGEEATTPFSLEGDLDYLFDPDIAIEEASLISWRDIIDPVLLLNEDFKDAIGDSIAREFIRVRRLDTEKDYYLIPFDKYIRGSFLSYAAIIVDAEDGHFIQSSYVKEPARYIHITEEEAVKSVIEENPEADAGSIDAHLVWQPGGPTSSPFYPYWEVTVGEKKYYVYY